MRKQTKKNSVLEKKLEELEYLIESLTFTDDDPKVYRDIELRVLFFKTLLATEIASRSMETEGEEVNEERLKLACMAKRLNELEEFLKNNQVFGHDNGSSDSNDGVVDGEAGLVCSWVNTCEDELGKAEEEKEEEEKGDVDAEQWPLFEDASLGKEVGNKDAEQWLLFEDASPYDKKGDEDAEQWPLFQDASSEEITFQAAVKEEMVVREVKEKRRFGFMDLVCFGLMGVIITLLLGYISDIIEEDPFLTPT